MLPDDNPPPWLEAFRAVAEKHGQTVRRDYFWGGEYTDEDGEVQYAEPRWDTCLCKEEFQKDGKIIAHCLFVDDRHDQWPEKWEMLIELNAMGFERTLEKEGYG